MAAEYIQRFLNGANLQSSTVVYSNNLLTTVAPDGYYSDGLVVRRQLSGILLDIEDCPECSSFDCSQNITIIPPQASRCQITYGINAVQGAVKVTIKGVKQAPIGISIVGSGNGLGTNSPYNTFSSTGLSGISNNLIAAPSTSAQSYFYTSNFCTAFSVPNFSLQKFIYNPNTNVFEGTGNSNTYSSTNKLSSALLSNTGDLIQYIPKTTSAAGDTLRVIANYFCSQGFPTVNVSCSTTLPTANNFTLTAQATPASACNQSISSATYAHGKVRGTVDGKFENGDYIFKTTGDLYEKLSDGYYRSISVNFPEATQGSGNTCSFKSTDGVISEVSDC